MTTEAQEKPEKAKPKVWTPPPDPLIRVTVTNKDLLGGEDENVPWSFVYKRPSVERPDGSIHRFSPISYPLKNNAEYELPTSVVEHLEQLTYPVRKYKKSDDEGQSMVTKITRARFTVSRLGPKRKTG